MSTKHDLHVRRAQTGFTLIELLIVVAIIAILAAIAVPNFLEAQTRAKISRTKNDLRTAVLALEVYKVDNNKYPWPKIAFTDAWSASSLPWIYELTTPIAYMTSLSYRDPFASKNPWYHYPGAPTDGFCGSIEMPLEYLYFSGWFAGSRQVDNPHEGYMLKGNGPDRWPQFPELGFFDNNQLPNKYVWGTTYNYAVYIGQFYDSTNGTMSGGDIARFGGDLPGAPNIQ